MIDAVESPKLRVVVLQSVGRHVYIVGIQKYLSRAYVVVFLYPIYVWRRDQTYSSSVESNRSWRRALWVFLYSVKTLVYTTW